MSGKLEPKTTFIILAWMASVSLIFFLAGVWIGSHLPGEAGPETNVVSADGGETPEEKEVEFYDQLLENPEGASDPAASSEDTAPPAPEKSADKKQKEPAKPDPEPAKTATASKPETKQPPREANDAGRRAYTIQLGALDSEADAKGLLSRLSEKGYQGTLVPPSGSGDKFFRVWVGEFADQKEAEELSGRLKSDRFDNFVKRARFPVGQ